MNVDLKLLSNSKKNLSGLVILENGDKLTDYQLRKVIELALERGYKKLYDISDEEVIEFINIVELSKKH